MQKSWVGSDVASVPSGNGYLAASQALRGFLPGPTRGRLLRTYVRADVRGGKRPRGRLRIKQPGTAPVRERRGPRETAARLPRLEAELSFLAIGLLCLFCLMILTFALNRLACCKARISGLLGL